MILKIIIMTTIANRINNKKILILKATIIKIMIVKIIILTIITLKLTHNRINNKFKLKIANLKIIIKATATI
jgi:hypothetical protein